MRSVFLLFSFIAAVSLALVCGAAAKAPEDAEPKAVEVTAKGPEFGDLSEVLQVRKTMGTFRFSRKIRSVSLRLQVYQGGKLVSDDRALGVFAKDGADAGKYVMHLIDLDYLPLGEAKPGHYLLHYRLEMNRISSTGKLVIPKSSFDISQSYGWNPFDANDGKPGEAPLFAIIGKHADAIIGGVPPEKLLEANPKADLLIATLIFE
jgi:hypothetical protein